MPVGGTRAVIGELRLPEAQVFLNPEFLRQGTALADFRSPTRVVVGWCGSGDPRLVERVEAALAGLPGVRLRVTFEEAEIIKNASNAFLALKLSFTNEMAMLTERYGGDIDQVLAGITSDPRIGATHMRPSFGFGGSCLPKELETVTRAGWERGLSMHVTAAASAANASTQAHFAQRVIRAMGGAEGRTVAVLGLAFKAGTDDVRESPAVALANALHQAGARVVGWDPQAALNAQAVAPWLETAASPEAAANGADAVVIATEWPELRALDWARIRGLVAAPLIADGRRLLDPAAMRALGYRYLAVGADEPVARTASGGRGGLTAASAGRAVGRGPPASTSQVPRRVRRSRARDPPDPVWIAVRLEVADASGTAPARHREHRGGPCLDLDHARPASEVRGATCLRCDPPGRLCERRAFLGERVESRPGRVGPVERSRDRREGRVRAGLGGEGRGRRRARPATRPPGWSPRDSEPVVRPASAVRVSSRTRSATAGGSSPATRTSPGSMATSIRTASRASSTAPASANADAALSNGATSAGRVARISRYKVRASSVRPAASRSTASRRRAWLIGSSSSARRASSMAASRSPAVARATLRTTSAGTRSGAAANASPARFAASAMSPMSRAATALW